MADTEILIDATAQAPVLNWGTKAVRAALAPGGSSRALPFMKTATLGDTLTLEQADEGYLLLTWDALAPLDSYDGIVQGGMLAVIADVAQGHTFSTTLDKPAGFSTVDLTTKYLRPVPSGMRYSIESRVIDRARRSAIIETYIRRQDGKVTTHFIGSWRMADRAFEVKS